MALEMKTVFLAICLGFGVHCDPCTQYEVLTGNYRSVNFEPESTESLRCDNLFVTTGQWYMFQDDLGNPRTLWGECVPVLNCGTQFPIWLNGEHPTSHNTHETAEVCANIQGCGSGGCYWRRNILIRRCSDDTFRYQLVTPPCVASYCSGNAPTCSSGLTWDPTEQECIRKMPLITMRPEIHPPVVVQTNDSYDFYIPCEIKYTPGTAVNVSRVAHFDAVFLFNGIADENTRKETDETNLVVRLNSAELAGHIGTSVQCDVRAFWEDSPHKSTAVRSENHWPVGIKIYDNTTGVFGELAPPITVSEANEQPRELYLVSSIPITCTYNSNCVLEVLVRSIGDVVSSVCIFSLAQSDWDDVLNRVYNSQPLLLSVVRTLQRKEDKIFAIDFEQLIFFGGNIWHNYDVQDVQVQYRDYNRSFCRSRGDPHITTFDGREYDVLEPGVFVYVRSSSSRIFEVQVRHFICSPWNVGCICGVVVREGNTILGVDACDFYLHRQTRKNPRMIQYSATRGPGAAIYSDTIDKFAICMGSGACVRMTIKDNYTDIYIDGIEEDFGKTTGLCGTYNGDATDEFTAPDGTVTSCGPDLDCPSNSNQWLVPHDQNLFLNTPDPVTIHYPQPELCQCATQEGQEIVCGAELNTGGADTPQEPQQAANVAGNGRKRRSTAPYTDHIVTKRSTHFVQKRQTTGYKWPTPSGITEERANQLCREPIVAATAYTKCYELFGEAIFDGIFACVGDIKISDNVIVSIGSAVEGMEVVCREKVFQLQRTEENEGTENDPVNIIKEVEQFICPSQCSGHGQCQNGTCTCDPEYIGADCSVQRDRPPTLNAVESENNGTCDVRQRPCRIAFLVVDNVVKSDNLICKISPVQYHENRQRQVGEAMNVAASVRSRWEITCSLPETPVSLNSSLTQPGASVYGFMVSVSNDGNSFSSESELTIFDSVCQSCDSPGNCVRQDSSCVIDGHCFESGEINPANNCEQCMPQKSMDSWSIRAESKKCVAWSEWGECNRECDYGIRTRERTCLDEESSCEGSNTEHYSCNLPDCTESLTDADEGIELVFEEVLENFLATKVSLLKQLLITSVNSGCDRDPAQCCRMAFLVLNRLSQTVYNITSAEFVDMTRIFEEDNNQIRTKWIMKIDRTLAEQSCRTSSEKKLQTESRYIDQQYLLDVVKENEERIEQVLDIQLVSIEKSVTTKKNPKSWVWWVVGGVIAVVVLVLVIISVICKYGP